MAEIVGEENEPNDLLLTILYVGKDLYEEIHRNLFVSESEIAERLQNDGEQFINDLLTGCRHLQRNREIMDGVYGKHVQFIKKSGPICRAIAGGLYQLFMLVCLPQRVRCRNTVDPSLGNCSASKFAIYRVNPPD